MTDYLILEKVLQSVGLSETNANTIALLINSMVNNDDPDLVIGQNSDMEIRYRNNEGQEIFTSMYLPKHSGDTGYLAQNLLIKE